MLDSVVARTLSTLLALLLLLGSAAGLPHCPSCDANKTAQAAATADCSMHASPTPQAHAPSTCCTPHACISSAFTATPDRRVEQASATPDELASATPRPSALPALTGLSPYLAPPSPLSAPPAPQRLILRL